MIDKKEKLVVRVNELYHDLAKEDYDSTTNLEMFRQEKERWQKIKNLFKNKKSITVLDIGTGTGFIPLTICGFLKKSDQFICSDISQEMLNLARKKLKIEGFKCKFRFLKWSKDISMKGNSVDIVTINSVLHHIPNTKYFLNEVNRVLKKNGLVIIGHEPNIRFKENKYLTFINHLLAILFKPKEEMKYLSVKFGIYEILDQLSGIFSSKRKRIVYHREIIAKKISEVLRKEGLIEKDLSIREVMSLVDYKTIGFDPFNIIPKYRVLHIETYHHLRGFEYSNKKFLKRYSENLKEYYPLDGKTFLAIYRK